MSQIPTTMLRARLEAERRGRKLRLADLEIEAAEIERRIIEIERELQNVPA